jgi:hypothetical protein
MTKQEAAVLYNLLGKYAADHVSSEQVSRAVEILQLAVKRLHGRIVERCPWCGEVDIYNVKSHNKECNHLHASTIGEGEGP